MAPPILPLHLFVLHVSSKKKQMLDDDFFRVPGATAWDDFTDDDEY